MLAQNPALVQPVEVVSARLLASPILQEYDISTVDEVARHPDEYEERAASSKVASPGK